MKNYYVTVTLKKDQDPPQEFSEIFGAKDDLTVQNDRAVQDAIRFASGLVLKNAGTECTHLALYKARIGVVKRDGSINSGKGKLLWETDSLTTPHVITNQIVITTPIIGAAAGGAIGALGAGKAMLPQPQTGLGGTMNIPQDRITIDPTTSLNPDEIFVFGSNESGIHGAGAAKQAMSFGAVYGQGVGLQGDTYAIPTKDASVRNAIPLDKVKEYVDEFVKFAKEHPEKKFLVTEIGCGYAKFTPEEIAPLFAELKDQAHVSFPQKFWDVLNKN